MAYPETEEFCLSRKILKNKLFEISDIQVLANVRKTVEIKAIGVPVEYATGTIRISLGRDNTESDVEEILKCFRKIMGE